MGHSVFIQDNPPLLLRGCITSGEYATEHNFLIGPAVDNAAEYMNCAQGAFVWFAPSAAIIIDKWIDSVCTEKLPPPLADYVRAGYDIFSPPYPVPMKNGASFTTRVVNPLYLKYDQSNTIIERYKNAMIGDSMDVWVKREYTLKFLETCLSLRKALNAAVKRFREQK
ncbi:MAG: hypothetical protein ABSF52_03355 [Syntrophobacteraceae bacterium]|jgi:hypothetical protein